MRPSSISCKPPAGWTPVPRDNPMRGGFILLGLCSLWPSSYSQSLGDWPVRVDRWAAGGLSLLLSCHPYTLLPREHDRGRGVGWTPAPPAHAWARRSFIHIRSFSR